ncbi:MAG: S8 family serine peptidase, partial [Synechococcus sp. SB0667_bin_8]|nr:S8 family serine peptidase [Synechococcus sp. SB0667_bin_8]
GGGGDGDGDDNACFTVSDGDCLTNTELGELGERVRQLTEELKDINHDQINNAWGRDSEAANALKWTAEAVNAHQAAAHLALAHGDGALNEEVTIGFIDTGIHEDHETFDYVSVDEEFLPGAVDEAPYEPSHGTAVASVAVGNFVSLPPDSPDFNINVKMFAIPLGDGSGPYRPITLEQLSATDFGDAAELNYVLSQDLDILNLSFGYQGGIENYSAQDLDKHYSRTIEALTQDGRSEKTILVWAAGNAGDRVNANSSSPTVLAGLAARAEELQGHSIAVVSTREDGRISDFSNRCGIAADFCIAAPGEQVLVATSVFYDLGSGTSFSAPMVSGGLITMKKLFRDQLSNEELVSRLFATANDDGIYANSAVYGHGLMDLGAATNPWGTLAFMDDPNSSVTNSQADACFKTHSGDCLTQSELAERARRLTLSATLSGVAGIDSYLRGFTGFEETSTAAKYPLEMINAYEALAYLELSRGPEAAAAPGSGVTIGLLNTGIDLSHSMFEFTNSIEEAFLLDATDDDWSSLAQLLGNGTAGIAAGRFGAYGADVKMFVPPSRGLDSDENSRMYEDILNNNLDIFISGSFDSSVDIEDLKTRAMVLTQSLPGYTEEEIIESNLRRSHGDSIEVLAQSEKQDNKTILIWPAGWPESNSEPSSSPSGYGGITPYIPELQGHSVAVVSVGKDGGISDFSNRCGLAAQFCIAAPGKNVFVAGPFDVDRGSILGIRSGSDLSAALVGGGLAVMKQLFRDQLTNEELVSRLFETANDDGIYADSAIYGQGLMDLGAAANPWGTLAFMGTLDATGALTPISSTSLTLGAPFGDGLANALASREVVAFDSLEHPFWLDADRFMGLSEGASLATRLNDFLHPYPVHSIPETWQFNFQENGTATEIGHLALANGASRLTMAGPQGLSASLFQHPQELEGLTLAWTPRTFDAFTVEAGYLNEQQSLLGSHGDGAGGHFSGDTLFLSAGLNVMVGNWQVAAQGELGQVNPAVGQSRFIDTISSLSTSAFRLAASRPFANGSTLRFSLSQPLRVERGSFTHYLVESGSSALSLAEAASAPLAPRGRQLDLTAKLDFPWWGGDVSLGATRSSQPGHQRTAAPQWTLFTAYRSTW